LHRGIDYHNSAVDRVELEGDRVVLADGAVLPYDVLIVATGARLVPEETEGLTGEGWMERGLSFYSLEGAAALEAAPPPLAGGRLVAYDGKEVGFDLAVVVPLHGGAEYVGRSPGLGDELNFVPTDNHTLQALARPNVFVIGDAANVPASKAGSVTHYEGEILVGNVRRFLAGEPLDATYDGHTNCFIETGFRKALLIDFNYETEPLPGHFPSPIGLPLLRESRLNHLGKLLFQSIYWHVLLPGRDVPGLGSAMPTAGKERTPPVHT